MFAYILLLKNPFVLAALGGLIMAGMLYYDDNSNGNEIVIKDYMKLFAGTFIIVVAAIYISRFNLGGLIGGSPAFIATRMVQPATSGGDMYPGMPDF